MAITYPPEMLPKADGPADVFVQRDDGKFVKLTDKEIQMFDRALIASSELHYELKV